MPCPYKSYPFYWSYRSYSSFALLLLAASAVLATQPAARKLLPETAVLDRVDGRLLHVDANDTWLFELTMEVKMPDWDPGPQPHNSAAGSPTKRDESRLGTQYRLPTGTRFVLLPSGMLGRLVTDVNNRVAPRYRLSARVTLYRGKNYLLPTYYLPLSKFKDEKGAKEGEQKPEADEPNPQSAIMSPPASTGGRNPQSKEPELAIPPEVLEKLKKQRPLRGPRRAAEAETKPIQAPAEQVLVDCAGRIENRGGRSVFVPYALGWNLSDVQYELLPCTALEEALRRQKGALDPIRLNVAGLVTEFQGKKYLLLQRAIVVYNYGNFGR